MRTVEEDIPIVKVELRDDVLGGLKFWCPFCRVYHLHGRGEGHRAPHCSTRANSPFSETGYILRIDPPRESKEYAERFERGGE